MYLKLIRNYWKGHVSRFVCLLLIFLVGISTVTCTGYLLRSQKDRRYNELATYHGLYDFRIFNVPVSLEDELVQLSQDGKIGSYGMYYELGYARNPYTGEDIKIASYNNTEAEELYHMNCFRGRYPTKSNEIAIDYLTANKLGLQGNVGEELTISVSALDGTALGERTYVVSGVFECSIEILECGAKRYPFNSFYDTGFDYKLPGIILNPYVSDEFNYSTEVFFFQSSNDDIFSDYDFIKDFIDSKDIESIKIEINYMHAFVVEETLGIDLIKMTEKYGSQSLDGLTLAIKDGLATQDPYTAVLIPVLMFLLCLVMVLSLILVIKNVIRDRQEMYGILRSIGLSSRFIALGLIAEITIIAIICLIIGNIIGLLLNVGIVDVGNKYYELQLNYGCNVVSYAKMVTFNPIVLSVVLCLSSLILALIIPVCNIVRLTPTAILNTENAFYKKIKKSKRKKRINNINWLNAINRRISIHTPVTLITMIVVLGCLIFGYSVFSLNSEKAAWEELSWVSLLNLDNYSFLAEEEYSNDQCGYHIYNHHDYGVSQEAVENVVNSSYVDDYIAIINNKSTRLAFDEQPDQDILSVIGNRLITQDFPDSDRGNISRRGQEKVLESWGYEANTLLYEVPTLGLLEQNLLAMNDCVIAGSINIDKIASGDEVVIAIPECLKDKCLTAFPIGYELPLSDIVLNDDEEKLDFLYFDAFDDPYIVYREQYKKTELFTVSYGKKKDITTKVGAIVVLNEEDYKYYLSNDSFEVRISEDETVGDVADKDTYGMSILTLDSRTFSAWGLPDHLFTELRVKPESKANLKEFNKIWVANVYKSKGVTVNSSFDFERRALVENAKVMFVYYSITVLLVIFGVISTIISLYSCIRDKDRQIKTLRMVGLSSKQCTLILILQNIFYPVVATVIALIPVYSVEALLKYIRNKVDSGQWRGTYDPYNKPWYVDLPFGFSMISNHFYIAVIVCLFIGVMMILIGTLPQIVYIRKTKMIREDE